MRAAMAPFREKAHERPHLPRRRVQDALPAGAPHVPPPLADGPQGPEAQGPSGIRHPPTREGDNWRGYLRAAIDAVREKEKAA